jgi:hypothetical protein
MSRTSKVLIAVAVLALVGIIWRWGFVSGEIAEAFQTRFR